MTYLGGYHTPRQMIYGAVMAFLVLIFYKLAKAIFNRRTNLMFYFVNLLLWLYVSMKYTSIKPDYNLIVKPGIVCGALVILAYYFERKEIKKLE